VVAIISNGVKIYYSIHEERLASGKLILPSDVALIGKGDTVVLKRNFFMRTPIAVKALVKLICINGVIIHKSREFRNGDHIEDTSHQLELHYLFQESGSGHWEHFEAAVLDRDGDNVVLTEDWHTSEYWKSSDERHFTKTSISAEILVKLIEDQQTELL
jgi:hypothetical protein